MSESTKGESKITDEEMVWISENAPGLGAGQVALGYLIEHRKSGISVTELHEKSINIITEESRPYTEKGYRFLKDNALKFGLTEFAEAKK